MKTMTFKFVEFMPQELNEGVLYISMEYATVIHLCACGCGYKVVTPLSPDDWNLTFNGESVSLSPSIGNWNFECRSHYWVIRNDVRWHDDRILNKLPLKELAKKKRRLSVLTMLKSSLRSIFN